MNKDSPSFRPCTSPSWILGRSSSWSRGHSRYTRDAARPRRICLVGEPVTAFSGAEVRAGKVSCPCRSAVSPGTPGRRAPWSDRSGRLCLAPDIDRRSHKAGAAFICQSGQPGWRWCGCPTQIYELDAYRPS